MFRAATLLLIQREPGVINADEGISSSSAPASQPTLQIKEESHRRRASFMFQIPRDSFTN